MRRLSKLVSIFVAATAATLLLAAVASAGTVTVNSTLDLVDGEGTAMEAAEGVGDNDDLCTLREAVQATNLDADVNGADDCDYVTPAGVADTITFAGDGLTYPFTSVFPGDRGEDQNQKGDLDIVPGPGLTIDGDTTLGNPSTINAGSLDRVLHIVSGGPVTIDGMILSNGVENTVGARGGGILNEGGNLTLTNSTVQLGEAEAGGGGIETKGSVTTQLTDSSLVGNKAKGASTATGGGIEVSGTGGGSLTLTNSQVKDSLAESSASTASGGGIYFAPSTTAASLNVTDSRIVNNEAKTTAAFQAQGGGVVVAGTGGSTFTRALIDSNDSNANLADANADVRGGGVFLNGAGATFTDSWIKSNTATTQDSGAEGRGAGIYNNNSSGTVRVVGTTISANILAFGAGDKLGAGIYNLGTLVLLNSTLHENAGGSGQGAGLKQDGGTATIVHSTFAGNDSTGGRNIDQGGGTVTIRGSVSDAFDTDCEGTITSADFNVGSDTSCSLTGTDDVENATTALGSLQDNGGPDAGGTTGGSAEPIPTVEPDIETSDAIDNVAAGSCTDDAAATLTDDQRDSLRPFDGDGDSIDECDSGAFEVAACLGEEATIVGTNGNDVGTIDGTSGDDVIAGAGGNDTIDGLDGADKLCGNAGTDTISGGPADGDADVYDGGSGIGDELSYAGDSAGVTANLTTGVAIGGDSLALGTIENLRGGTNDDTLNGDGDANAIVGGGGNDDLIGEGDDDVLAPGAGSDDLDGAGGTNTADYTGAPAITASLQAGTASGDGPDTFLDIQNLRGGSGGDNLTGDGSANLIEGGAGTDTITGLGATDQLLGEANNDSIFARDGIQDNVNCAGDAADSVEADATGVDTIDASCENVSFFVPAALSVAPSTQDFGSTQAGTPTAAVQFTVTNSGLGTSGSLSVALSGANASEFGITQDNCTGTLAGGANCTVFVRMAPTSAGAKAASLDISGTPGGSDSSALTGTATAVSTPPPATTTPAETGQRAAALKKCKKKKKKLDWSKKRYNKCKRQANQLPV